MRLALPSIPFALVTSALLAVGCPGDDTGDEGASTASDHGSEDHGTTAHATDDHGTTAHGSDDHGTTAHGSDDHATADHGIETSADDPAVAYCSCMLANCHDAYHGKWGEDEMAAEVACLAEAEGLPVNGADIEMGNFIECRQHFCDMAATDEALCANAIGDAVCI